MSRDGAAQPGTGRFRDPVREPRNMSIESEHARNGLGTTYTGTLSRILRRATGDPSPHG